MNEKLLSDLYEKRGYDSATTDEAVSFVKEMEATLARDNISFDEPSLDDVKEYLIGIVESTQNSPSRLLALARYYFVINKHDIYIYFTKLFGGYGVMDNIKKRLEWHTDKETVEIIFKGLDEPVLGSPPEILPKFTAAFMQRLKKHLSPS